MMTDPIADMLTRIRNGFRSGNAMVEVPASKMKKAVADVLVSEGYLESVRAEKKGNGAVLQITLKYYGKQPAVQSVFRESKPGHRAYCKASELPRVLNDHGIAIVSTSRGIMTNKQARKEGVGGEVICSIY